ncbi:MAG: peptidase, partial [Planctomycetes bacterium]|nr:peptidase [Planctomycetota bacterium]
PPGISSAGAITIPKDQTEAAYPLNAAGDAPLLTHKLALLAHANAGGDRWCSSLPAPITVSDVFATGKLQLAAIERGKSGVALCKIEQRRPWEGVAKLVLQGLPAKVSATPVEIAAGATEAVFPIATEADAPVGQHSGLFCELTAVVGGQPVTHRLAMGGAIRIDAPPAVAAAPASPAQPAAPAATPPKPLSRLEQLRKEADERAAASQPAKGTP